MCSFRSNPAAQQPPLNGSPFHEWKLPDGATWTQFYRSVGGYILRFPGLADFQVSRDGECITCTPAIGVEDKTSQHLYLNQVLPLALSRKGKLLFHASAVDIGGSAIAFVGESGRGKSTLAASFATSGYRFLTDDGLMIEADRGDYQVMPSHPSIRLWQDSEEALITAEVPMAPSLDFTSKGRFLAGEFIPFCESPLRLGKVYFLGDGSASQITFQEVAPAAALIELVKHSFLLDIEEQNLLATHFDELSKLANLPIYYRLDYPRRYEELPDIRQAIIQHAAQHEGLA